MPVSELSLCLDAQAHSKGCPSFALGLQYVPDLTSPAGAGRAQTPDLSKLFGYEDLLEETDDHNLLSRFHEGSLILVMKACLHADIIRGSRELQQLTQIKNCFIYPEVVSYSDYINSGYEALMRRQKEAKQLQKKKGKQGSTLAGNTGNSHVCF